MGDAYPPDSCYPSGSPSTLEAVDGTGWRMNFNGIGNPATAISPDGTQYFAVYTNGNVTGYAMRDRNGNQITRGWTQTSGMSNYLTDTLGRTLNINPVLNSSTGKYELTYNDTNGNAQKIIIAKSSVTVNAVVPYECSGDVCQDRAYSATWQLPTEILLPNGMKYTIAYYQNAYANVSSITLPTGATVSYTYATGSDYSGRRVISRSVTSDGQSATWNYNYSVPGTLPQVNTVTDPAGNDTAYHYTGGPDSGSPTSVEQIVEVDSFAGSSSGGTLLKKTQTDYFNGRISLPIHETTTWPQQGNLQSRVETDYHTWTNTGNCAATCTWGDIAEQREYAFGTGTYGALARKTHYDYAHVPGNSGYNANYATRNLVRQFCPSSEPWTDS